MNQQNQALVKKDETSVEFIPLGADEKIKLSIAVIQNLIAVPTRSGKTCSTRDAMKFLMLCRAKKLDPFSGDAYLIGYDGKDGVATFSLITAHQAYLKRAELHPEFDGMQSGVIVQGDAGKTVDLEGDFHTEDQDVVGGWATVHFKERKIPITRRVRLKRFQKSFGVWQDDPAGMIVKCAEADALRSAFPTMLGGLYMKEEIDISKPRESFEIPASKLVDVYIAPANNRGATEPTDDLNYGDRGTAQVQNAKANGAAKVELAGLIEGAGFTFDQFQRFAEASGLIKDASSLAGWDDVTDADAKRLLRAKTGLLKSLEPLRSEGGETKSEGELV